MIDRRSNGQEILTAPKEAPERYIAERGYFAGWISKEWGVAWSVSKYRKDKRTGAVPSKKVEPYLLQYRSRRVGRNGENWPVYIGIAATDHADAVVQAKKRMDQLGLGKAERRSAELYYNEKRLAL